MDLEKAFDSVNRGSVWNIQRHYGMPLKLVLLIKSFYENFRCSIGHSDTLFDFKTGVRQGFVMSAILFNLIIDWVISKKQKKKRHEEYTGLLFSTLDGLDFANDQTLLSNIDCHIQEKTDILHLF